MGMADNHIIRHPDRPEVPSVRLSVVIVNWNSAAYVRGSINSIYEFTKGLPLEIIVIDNASFDGCGEMLAREFPKVVYLQSQENLGFAKANNLAAAHAHGGVLLFLNPDTLLSGPAIEVLYKHLFSMPNAGAVGARLLNRDGSVQTSCVQSFPTILNQALDSEFLHRVFPNWSIWGTAPLLATKPVPAQAVSGACVMVKREVFDQIGGFSNVYFMYGEDLDLCFKVRKAGRFVYHVPEATFVHFGGGSSRTISNFSHVMMRESVWLFFHYNYGPASAFTYRVSMAAVSIPRIILLLAVLPIRGFAPLGKWLSIFRWSLGQDEQARKAPLCSPRSRNATATATAL